MDGLPDHGEIEKALVELLIARSNRPLTADEAYTLLADHFQLDWQAASAELISASGRENKWQNRCRSARNHLVKRDWLNRDPYNSWSLTDHYLRARAAFEEL